MGGLNCVIDIKSGMEMCGVLLLFVVDVGFYMC